MAERDRIGFIGVPWASVPSKQPGSMGIMFDKISRMLPTHCESFVVSGAYAPDPEAEAEGVTYHRILDRKDRLICRNLYHLRRLWPGAGSDYHFSPFFHKHYALRAAEYLAKQEADAIIFPLYPQWAPVLHGKNPKAKLILWMQCEWLSAGPPWYEKYLDKIHRIVCCSDYLSDKIAKRYPQVSDRLRTVYNGVDSKLFHDSQIRCRHQILYAGRLTPEKGAHVLLRAFEQVRVRYPDAQLILAGPFWITPASQLVGALPKDLKKWRRKGKRYEIKIHRKAKKVGNVFLTDRVSHRALAKLYQTASILVHPALWNEPFGMILGEAMASGLPVVASRCGGVPEVVQDNRSGLLVEPGDVNGLIAAIERLFENKELASRMGAAGRARVEELFEWKNLADQMARIALE